MLHIKSGIFCKFRAVLGIILVFGIYSPISTAATPEFELLQSLGKREGKPSGKLIQDADGNLFGTTYYGGNNGFGAVFKINPSGIYSVIYSFDGILGAGPTGLIQGKDGKFYGVTLGSSGQLFPGYPSMSGGGVRHDRGTVFQLDISGTKPVHTILYDFGRNNGELGGFYPSAGLIQGSDGMFYGTTIAGGCCSSGTVYQLNTSGTTPVYKVLYEFVGDRRFFGTPFQGALMQGSDGKFYGTRYDYAEGDSGFVYQLDISGQTPVFTVLHQFKDVTNGGGFPLGELIQGKDGKLYGTSTGDTGLYGISYGVNGTVFQIDISGSTPIFTVLHEFTDSIGEGSKAGLTQGKDGKLYGTTTGNGNFKYGTVFRLDNSGAVPTYTVLHEFDGVDGVAPDASLFQGSDGKFYGTTSGGGIGGTGTVFQLDLSGATSAHTVLYAFKRSNGGGPSGMIEGNDGKFYGNLSYSQSQSIYSKGNIFQLDLTGAKPIYTDLHLLDYTYKSGSTQAGVIQGNDGKLYGTTLDGGSANLGTVYQFDISRPKPVYTVLHEFDEKTGYFTYSGVIQASDGKLYGSTYYGGSAGAGTVFQFDTSGAKPVYNVLHDSFLGFPAGLIQGKDGKFYGTTSGGGSGGRAVFQLDISGAAPVYSVLYSFDVFTVPLTLVQGIDGKFYGTASIGGITEHGTLFQIDMSGATPNFTVLHTFNGDDGYSPGALIQAHDGNIYGATSGGGQFGGGVIYRLRMPPANTPPVAVNDSFALHAPKRKAPVTVAAPGVLGNDKDVEGNPLTVVGAMGTTPKIIEFPHEGGKVALYADGHFVYTPTKGCFYGTRSFTYQSTDGQTASNTATVTLTTIPQGMKATGTTTNTVRMNIGNTNTDDGQTATEFAS